MQTAALNESEGLLARSPVHEDGSDSRRKILAVGGGKGGIGKSILSANLGVLLASQGRRVVLIDADLGGANLHTVLGIKPPPRGLSDFVTRKVSDLREVISPTKVDRLSLISGALDDLGAANLKYTQKLRLLREIMALDVDTIIIDLGGGTGFNILDFFLIADHGILTIVPEPTSIENAYRFIKAAYYRRLKTLEGSEELKPLLKQAMEMRGQAGLQTPADLVRFITSQHPQAGEYLRNELRRLPLGLVVNQVREPNEEALLEAVSGACGKYFGINLRQLGWIPYDDAVWKSIRRRHPVVSMAPQSAASSRIRDIAASLGFAQAQEDYAA